MTNTKMTKVEALAQALEIIGLMEEQERPIELIDKLEAMKAQEVKTAEKKRNSKGTSKIAKEKAENVAKLQAFFDNDTTGEPFTNAELAQVLEMENATPQKITPIIKEVQGVEKTTKDKKVAYKKVSE